MIEDEIIEKRNDFTDSKDKQVKRKKYENKAQNGVDVNDSIQDFKSEFKTDTEIFYEKLDEFQIVAAQRQRNLSNIDRIVQRLRNKGL